MSVSHVLLGLLVAGPAHGYDLKQAHDASFPAAKPLAYGQVYAALAKLEKDALVEVVESGSAGGPERTTYAATDLGRETLTAWLVATEPAGPYPADELVRKTVTALRLGRDAGSFLAAQRRVHLAAMKQLLAEQGAEGGPIAAIVVDHAVEHLDADLRWLENAIARAAAAREKTTHHRSAEHIEESA